MIVSIQKLRCKISMFLDALNNGEDIAFGIWSDREKDMDKMARILRKGRSFDV